MPVKVICPNPGCDASYSVAEEKVGRKAQCPKCGTRFVVSAGEKPGEFFPTAVPSSTWPEASPPPTPIAFPNRAAGVLTPGTVFGRYQIEGLLGRGGMGAVYKARDQVLCRQVALKVPNFHADERPDIIRRFVQEAKAAAGFDNPNLCQVFDVGQVDGVHYLTMPYLEGRPLSSIVREGALDPAEAAGIVRTLALALAEAHDRGVFHRDLKPANVMMNPRRGPIVMDFGLALLAESDDSRITQSGVFLGTVSYMSPEQVDGNLDTNAAASDQYSLGVILFELLAGRLPFQGPPTSVLVKIKTTPPPLLEVLDPRIDPKLAAICNKALAKLPGDRFPSCRALAEALDDWLEGRKGPTPSRIPSRATPVQQPRIATQAPAPPNQAPTETFAIEPEVVLVPLERSTTPGGVNSPPPAGPLRRRLAQAGLWGYPIAVSIRGLFEFSSNEYFLVLSLLFVGALAAISIVPAQTALLRRPSRVMLWLSCLVYLPLLWWQALMTAVVISSSIHSTRGVASDATDPAPLLSVLAFLLAPTIFAISIMRNRRSGTATIARSINSLVFWLMTATLVVLIPSCLVINLYARNSITREMVSSSFFVTALCLGPAVLFHYAETVRGVPIGGGSTRWRFGPFQFRLPAPEWIALPLLGLAMLAHWFAGSGDPAP